MIATENSELCDKDVASYYKEKFILYVSNLPIEDNFKNLIADEGFIKDNPIFYIYYPKLFSSAFTELDPKNLDLLCIAGYLYYRSTLFLDSIIDKNSKKGLFLALICQEEATKIMTSIFDLDSSYWKFWSLRRQEYLKAIRIEKTFAEGDKKISLDDYSELADFKAAFGKSAIDALFQSSGKKKEREFKKLLLSHKYFSVAFQINDDVLDFKDDCKNGQFNLAVHEINNANPSSNSIEELNKLFYIRGHAKNLFSKAIDYLDKALIEVKDIDVPLWNSEIKKLKKKFIYSIVEIDNYLKRLNSEIRLSKEIVPEQPITDSIEKAINFIKDSQNEDGSWNEYINQGGISDIWSTAFICSKLSENPLKGNFVDQLDRALSFLQKSKHQNIWGYNSSWVGDADTTNFVLISFLNNSIPIDDSILNEWIQYYKNEQGFSTYKDQEKLITSLSDDNISNVTTWTSGHQCVSAVSFYFLTISKKFPVEQRILNDLFKKNLFSNSIESFWWTSNVYTLYFLIKSFALLDEKSIVKHIAEKTAEIQNNDGSFSDKYGPNFFITALALVILMQSFEDFENEIDKGISFLLNNQYSDGSWENSNALQIPDPAVKENEKFYPVNTHGTSVRAREFNRLFTTVSIMESLTIYEKKITSTPTI